MRILQISSTISYGGGERHFVDLCRGLDEAGHEVFAALRPTNKWGSHLDFLPVGRVLHVSIRNSFGMFSSKRIARFIDRNGIDILHAHIARDYLAASIAARIAGNVRLVLTRHAVSPMKPFHRFALRNVDAAIALSPAAADHLYKVFPPSKVRTIPNGIALDAAGPNERAALGAGFRSDHGIPAASPLIATIGELKPVNGQRDLLLAANEVLKEVPDTRFVIVGKDNTLDQKFRRELKRLARVLGIDASFLWLDWVDELKPLLSATDVLVSPSHSESFAPVIVEAMSAGTPVLATGTDGAREILAEGALTPVKDPYQLSEKIVHLLSDAAMRNELGRTLAESARERFGIGKMIGATVGLYEELLRGKN